VTDAVVLAAQTGGAILVTQSGTVKRQQLEAAIGILEAGDVTLLGLVLKDVPIDTRHHYYSAYYSSHPAERPAPAAKPGRRAQVEV
jgi:Mrp family chromosome partitioning ATPase